MGINYPVLFNTGYSGKILQTFGAALLLQINSIEIMSGA